MCPLHSHRPDLQTRHHFRLRLQAFLRDRHHRKLGMVGLRACFRRVLPVDHRWEGKWEVFSNQDHHNHRWDLGRLLVLVLLLWGHHLECHLACLLDFTSSRMGNKLMEGDDLLASIKCWSREN